MDKPRFRHVVALGLALAIVAGVGVLVGVRRAVRRALESPSEETRPARWAVLVKPSLVPLHWTGGDVDGVVATDDGLLIAGAFGASRGQQGWGLACGLPSVHIGALALWRGTPVLAPTAGGLFRLRGDACEELRTGFGTLHARSLHETNAGELIVAAREGLFRLPWGTGRVERLSRHSARACESLDAEIIVGTEEGLFRVAPTGMTRIATPDPWIESVAVLDDTLLAVTAAGLARGPIEGPLVPVEGGEEIVQGTLHSGRFYGATDPPQRSLRFVGRDDARIREEHLPDLARRVFSAGGSLFADTPAGLYRRTASGWHLDRSRSATALPPGTTHITALTATPERIVAGLFDQGLRVASVGQDGTLSWRVPRGSAAWGVNALLDAGGATFVASLRGLARLDNGVVRPVDEIEGAAFALLSTPTGIVVGQGLGVRLPSGRLVSAFHGLPGNQATALALERETVIVGTPSGLGALRASRVVWSLHPGDGRLPHPWVTALARRHDDLYVGTYGGGVVRRRPSARDDAAGPGVFEPFVETEGLRVNAGCLAANESEVVFGTEGQGLWRLTADGSRFERVGLPLPGPRVTALAWQGQALLVGTDEGLARIDLGRAR